MALVSILLPNLNNRDFLEERVESIQCQTLQDWELIVVDNYSDDGAWGFFQQLAQGDSRVRISQAPREGMYANWNNCIRLATAPYVYIATSDDTMAPDCLEKLVKALESHPECDLAHCMLKMVDAKGEPAPDWWTRGSVFARSSGGLINQPHLRMAPFDGLLHLGGESVYTSITQLLIRRSLFDKIGCFETRWGSMGDFHWDMRASLAGSTVHVPDTWGGWRVHPAQATAANTPLDFRNRIEEMISDALVRSQPFLRPSIRQQLSACWIAEARDLRRISWGVRSYASPRLRGAFLVGNLLAGSRFARRHLTAKLQGKTMPRAVAISELVHSWIGGGECRPVSVGAS